MKNKTNPNIKIKLDSISKSFKVEGKEKLVLDNINLEVKDGEFVSIVGPSGCGKTTLLNIIAGLDNQDKGVIRINFKTSYSSRERSESRSNVIPDPIGNLDSRFRGNDKTGIQRLGKISYMQQKDLLFSWRSVVDNAILGLELKGISKSTAREKAMSVMDTFGLSGFENQYPFTLSGGMRQRAAFLRTVLLNQDIMLLDEPFGALDALTRVKMREWLENLWQRLDKTIILVTHDIEEAILLSDRIYVLSQRPAKVVTMLNVNLKRPRHYKMITEPDFVKTKKILLNSLHKEI